MRTILSNYLELPSSTISVNFRLLICLLHGWNLISMFDGSKHWLTDDKSVSERAWSEFLYEFYGVMHVHATVYAMIWCDVSVWPFTTSSSKCHVVSCGMLSDSIVKDLDENPMGSPFWCTTRLLREEVLLTLWRFCFCYTVNHLWFLQMMMMF